MPDLLDFPTIAARSIEDVMAAIVADANAGVDPHDRLFLDVVPGSILMDFMTAFGMRLVEEHDFASKEAPAQALPSTASGVHLDNWAEALGLTRKDEVAATGEATFFGADGLVVQPGTVISTVTASETEEPLEYQTTEGGTIAAGEVTLALEATEPGAQHNVSANTVTLMISQISGITAVANAEPIRGGADVESDAALRERVLLELAGEQGSGNRVDYERWALAWEGVGNVTVQPYWAGPGTVRVLITDVDNDPVSQLTIDELQADLDPYRAATELNGGHTLPDATIDVDSTDGFRDFGELMVGPNFVAYTGKTAIQFQGCTGGSGAVADNALVRQSGEGTGTAPITHVVTVSTPTSTSVTIAAVVEHETGYSLTGASGARATEEELIAAISRYVNELEVGGDVILNKVIAAIVDTEGVANVSDIELNGVAADFAIAAESVAEVDTVTLT